MKTETLKENVIEWLEILFSEKLNTPVSFVYNQSINTYSAHCFELGVQLEFPPCDEYYYKSGCKLACVNYTFNPDERYFSQPFDLISIPSSRLQILERFSFSRDIIFTPFDLPGLVFWCLSRLEEVNASEKDEHDRFSAKQSHAYKFGYLNRPIIDEWFLVLKLFMEHHIEMYTAHKSCYSLELSHDVDRPMRYAFAPFSQAIKSLAADLVNRHKLLSPLELIFSKLYSNKSLYKKDSFNTFDWICNEAIKNNKKNTFYFICGKTSDKDADYKLTHPAIRNLIKELHIQGHKIGIHPSYNTYLDFNSLKVEFDLLRRTLNELDIPFVDIDSRMHFLRWKTPYTLRILSRLGIKSDGTLGYADSPGFRCSTCFEYLAVDPETGFKVDVKVQPLILMEASLLASRYLGIKNDIEAFKYIDNLRNNCKRVGGQFRVLWHNSELTTSSQKEIYSYLYKESEHE